MDRLREELISRVDSLISQAIEGADSGAYVQFEACIFHDQSPSSPQTTPRRVVLATLNIDDLLQNHRIDPGDSSSTSSTRIEPGHAAVHRQPDAPDWLPTPARSPRPESSSHHEMNPAISLTGQFGPRRKEVGGLRLGRPEDRAIHTPPSTPVSATGRQLGTDERNFPKRRRLDHPAKLEQSTVDKLIEGIWQQIHRPGSLALGPELGHVFKTVSERLARGIGGSLKQVDFEDASRCCQQITAGSRTSRALEVIVQAYWVDCYDARLTALRQARPELKTYEARKIVLTEACTHFQWSEKELRNRLAIWKGYREIKDAAGWVALIFAGPGIYRFCKYRMGFEQDALAKLQAMRTRAEVAADTIQPQWRELLSLVGASTQLHWRGHPHDWVVSKRKDPVPLGFTYRHLDIPFSFKHLTESVIDETKWPDSDPRRVSTEPFKCTTCSGRQSMLAEENECECYPDLFGPAPGTRPPVQVFRTDAGKNNGLMACCTFERGQAIGEFVGLVTKGLDGVDVMHGQAGSSEPYQIWQGKCGNFTRFINHSCQPNCQFTIFVWLGIQRIIVVSKGLAAGKEITVDYSNKYWNGLDKNCLCGESRCRYKGRSVETHAVQSS